MPKDREEDDTIPIRFFEGCLWATLFSLVLWAIIGGGIVALCKKVWCFG